MSSKSPSAMNTAPMRFIGFRKDYNGTVWSCVSTKNESGMSTAELSSSYKPDKRKDIRL